MSLAELRALAAESYDGVRQKVWPWPNPAAGADFRITVPSPQFWLPVALFATLTTSSEVANRLPTLRVTDGTTTVFEAPVGAGLDESGTLTYSWIRDLATGATNADTTVTSNQLPCPALPTGWTIGTSTGDIDDTDQWSAIAITVVQITGGQPAQAGRRETSILEHWQALHELIGQG